MGVWCSGMSFTINSIKSGTFASEALPLTSGGYANYEFMQVGPLAPLGLLLQGK